MNWNDRADGVAAPPGESLSFAGAGAGAFSTRTALRHGLRDPVVADQIVRELTGGTSTERESADRAGLVCASGREPGVIERAQGGRYLRDDGA